MSGVCEARSPPLHVHNLLYYTICTYMIQHPTLLLFSRQLGVVLRAPLASSTLARVRISHHIVSSHRVLSPATQDTVSQQRLPTCSPAIFSLGHRTEPSDEARRVRCGGRRFSGRGGSSKVLAWAPALLAASGGAARSWRCTAQFAASVIVAERCISCSNGDGGRRE